MGPTKGLYLVGDQNASGHIAAASLTRLIKRGRSYCGAARPVQTGTVFERLSQWRLAEHGATAKADRPP